MTSPKTDYPNAPRQYPNAEPGAPGALPGADPAFESQLYRLAPSRVTVLLVGGTPEVKRAVARALHERSPRRQQPFVVFDCHGLASETVELGLFGGPAHEPAMAGAIQQVEAGTLYVATINELPLLAQPRFLRFLDQDRNARVVASTETDLVVQVERGRFRFDLAERLGLVELALPEELHSVYPHDR